MKDLNINKKNVSPSAQNGPCYIAKTFTGKSPSIKIENVSSKISYY